MTQKERRLNNRIEISIDVLDKENNVSLGKIKNLTQVGCFITSNGKLPEVGTITTIAFILPGNGMEISTKAKVMWYKDEPNGLGMLFFSMKDNYFSHLQDFMEKSR